MKRVLTVLAILLITLLPGFALAQKGGPPPYGVRNQGARTGVLTGTIANLAAGSTGTAFVLKAGNDSITVDIAAETTVTNLSDGSTATLSNGLPVAVKGTYNAGTMVLTATSIVVNNEAIGTVSNLVINATGYTFDLTVGRNQMLNVTASSTVPVTDDSNKSVSAVAEGRQVMVAGVVNGTTMTVTATAIVVNDRLPPFKRFGVVSGLATASTGSTFHLTDNRGNVLAVTTAATTKTLLYSSNAATTLANGQSVFVNGSYDSATKVLTATSVVVDDKKKPAANLSVTGVVASVNATAKSLVVALKGSNVQPTATTVAVLVTSSTTYKTGQGKQGTMSAVTVGSVVQAEGTFDATTQTLTATSISVGSTNSK